MPSYVYFLPFLCLCTWRVLALFSSLPYSLCFHRYVASTYFLILRNWLMLFEDYINMHGLSAAHTSCYLKTFGCFRLEPTVADCSQLSLCN